MKRAPRLAAIAVAVAFGLSLTAAAAGLSDALSLIPAGTDDLMLLFTDWDGIRLSLGLDDVTSASPLDLRLQLGMSTSGGHAAGSAFALQHLADHASNWGWDTTDLRWEARVIAGRLPPFYLLKLREHISLDAIAVHFVERGFVQTTSHGATVFHHGLVAGEDWLRTTEISILNVAYLEDEHLLILSAFAGGIDAALAARTGALPAANNTFLGAAVDHLDSPLAAVLLVGLGECLRFTANPVLDALGTVPTQEAIEAMRDAARNAELLVPYRVFAVGYREIDGAPVGSIVFEYDSAELAAVDLEPRRLLAEEGMSSSFEAPIAESYFTVLSAGVEERAIVFTVAPVNGQPSRLLRMVLYRDAPYAGCSAPGP